MKYKFFVGHSYQKIHYKFIQSILKGDYVTYNCNTSETKFSNEIFQHDGSDVIWFFTHIYPNLHPKLKGKQILVGHGLGFKQRLFKQRVDTINQYIDLVFQTGVTNDREYKKNGVVIDKIRKIGYALLFEIPNLPVRPNSVLFSFTIFYHWAYLDNLINILKEIDDGINGYLTIHPLFPRINIAKQNLLIEICKQKNNLTLLRTQEELLDACAYCQYYAGGISSVAVPFWYLQKPVIFITNYKRISLLNKLRMARYANDAFLFYKILSESSIFSARMKFDAEFMKNAKISRSAKKIFYPSNFDRALTIALIKEAIKEIEERND